MSASPAAWCRYVWFVRDPSGSPSGEEHQCTLEQGHPPPHKCFACKRVEVEEAPCWWCGQNNAWQADRCRACKGPFVPAQVSTFGANLICAAAYAGAKGVHVLDRRNRR